MRSLLKRATLKTPAESATFAPTSAAGRVQTLKAAVSRPKVRALYTAVARVRPTITFASGTTALGPDLTTLAFTPNGSWAKSWGPVGWDQYGGSSWADYDPYNAGNQAGNPHIEFCSDAPLIALKVGTGAHMWQVYVNGELIAGAALGTEYTSSNFQILDWAGVRQSRRYQLRLSSGTTFGGVVTTPVDSVWAPTDDSDVLMGWMGDSYSQSGATDGFDTIPGLVARMLGWKQITSAAGGTGYTNPTGTVANGTPGNFEQRIPEFLSLNTRGYSVARPDVMILAGGHNNTGASAATMQARVEAIIDTLVAGGMKAGQIVVLGVLDQGDFWHNGTYVAVNAGLAAGAASRGVVFIANPGWITGTGYQGSRTVTDAVANSTTTVTSATAAFGAGDVGNTVTATGMTTSPTTYIASVTNSTTAVLNQAWPVTGSGKTLTITNQRRDGNADVNIYTDATHPSPPGVEYFAARIANALTGAF